LRFVTFILILCIIFSLQKSSAQDPHFSQFFASPLTVNPAFTGKFDGTYRVASNHRNQWPSINNAFITTTASFDTKLMQKSINENDSWGIGFTGYSDSHANGAIKFNALSFSTAYHKGIDEDNNTQIGFGFQITQANMLVNTNQIKFEDQLTNAGFTGLTTEIFNTPSLSASHMSISAGLLLNGTMGEQNNYYLGLSMYHLNRPRQTFLGGNFSVNPRFTIHGGGYFYIGTNATLHISAMHQIQGGAQETMVGGALQISTDPQNDRAASLYIGSWMRLKDSFIPYAGIEINDFRLGLTYDVNNSLVKTASETMGGIEVSLIYTRKPRTDKPIICPKF
jgi:type IX secretion system PorP/SprF family membrane protein